MGLPRTHSTACMSAWANLLRRPHRRLKEWRRHSRRCRALKDLRAIKMIISALQRSRLPWKACPTRGDGPLQRRLEGGLRQTTSVLLGSEVSELAWERAKFSTCFDESLSIWVAQMGFAAQATYWSAVNLHKAVMTSIFELLNRPTREPHPEVATWPQRQICSYRGSLLMSMPE